MGFNLGFKGLMILEAGQRGGHKTSLHI